jgi:hypothetical protein
VVEFHVDSDLRSTVHSYAMQPVQIELDNSPLKANLHLLHIFSLIIRLGFWPYQRWDIAKQWGLCLQLSCLLAGVNWMVWKQTGEHVASAILEENHLNALFCHVYIAVGSKWAVKFTMAGSCTGWLKAVILLAPVSTSHHILHCVISHFDSYRFS